MKEDTPSPVMSEQTDSLNLSWRDKRYHRFYEVVDRLVDELQACHLQIDLIFVPISKDL